jgi:hypothetical protein
MEDTLLNKDANQQHALGNSMYCTAIAEILSDMDAEIDMLAAKLSKSRQVKQGMMSQLLTGKVRLV